MTEFIAMPPPSCGIAGTMSTLPLPFTAEEADNAPSAADAADLNVQP